MEIIKKGNAHKWHVYYCKCPLCGTEVKILKGDPDIIKYHNVRDTYSEHITWKCPVCEEDVLTITGSDIYGSGKKNLISEANETISLEEKELLNSWTDTVNQSNPDNVYCTGKWNSNN